MFSLGRGGPSGFSSASQLQVTLEVESTFTKQKLVYEEYGFMERSGQLIASQMNDLSLL